ncbi:uncharacterized protein LOC143426397 [Xylocopa sonorina]|uniref:uncharacterized protein LOC143426397 n=1 Tax=Xylocopa sonorina TaxID=1818115 RepID=UPI00403ADDB6
MKGMKEELFKWACKKDATHSFLDRRMVREKALQLTSIRGFNAFKCSNAWLTNFLREHGFPTGPRSQSGPIFKDYREWIELIRPMIIKYRYRDLFHADELTMYSDIPPSMVSSTQIEGGGNRIKILMGCDSSGHTKLPLLVYGPYPGTIQTKEHIYHNCEDSHIEDELFRNWMTSLNERMTRCERKILMFLRREKARALNDFTASNVKLVYFPANFPAHLRPLRKHVFHYVKMIYRRRYAERTQRSNGEWKFREDILPSLIDAWESIPRELIIFSFQRAHLRLDDCFLQFDCDCWNSSAIGISFKKFVTFDDDLSDEHVPYRGSNNRRRFNLRTNCQVVLQINEDSLHLSPSHTNEFERFRPNRKLDNPLTTLNDRHQIEGNCKSGKVQGKTCEDGGVNDAYVSSISKENTSEEHRVIAIDAQESLQALMDKALTLLSSEKANCAKTLIDGIRVTSQETNRAANDLPQYEHFNDRRDADSVHTDREIAPSSLDSFHGKFNQPSTSTNNWNVSAVKDQSVKNTVESQLLKGTSLGTFRLDSQNSDLIGNPGDEIGSSVIREQLVSFSKKKRRESSTDLNASEDDEPREKRSKTDRNWSKQFETTFVFGSPDRNYPSAVQHDENVVDSCVFNASPSSMSPRD